MLSNLREWFNITDTTWMIIIVALIVFGIVCAFFGYRLVRFLVALQGFLVGSIAALLILSQVSELAGWPLVLVCLVIGLAVGALSFFVFRLGLFLLAGIAGFLVIGGLLGTFMTNFAVMCVLAAIGGVAIGVLAVIFTRPIIIVATAFGGGWFAAEHLLRELIFANSVVPVWAMYIAAGILIALGLYIQFAHTAKKAD